VNQTGGENRKLSVNFSVAETPETSQKRSKGNAKRTAGEEGVSQLFSQDPFEDYLTHEPCGR